MNYLKNICGFPLTITISFVIGTREFVPHIPFIIPVLIVDSI